MASCMAVTTGKMKNPFKMVTNWLHHKEMVFMLGKVLGSTLKAN